MLVLVCVCFFELWFCVWTLIIDRGRFVGDPPPKRQQDFIYSRSCVRYKTKKERERIYIEVVLGFRERIILIREREKFFVCVLRRTPTTKACLLLYFFL